MFHFLVYWSRYLLLKKAGDVTRAYITNHFLHWTMHTTLYIYLLLPNLVFLSYKILSFDSQNVARIMIYDWG